MSTAFNHMPPFIRIRSFIFQEMSALEAKVKDATDELKMWQEPEIQALVGEAAPEVQAILVPYAPDAEKRIAAAKARYELLRRFYDSMEVCTNCNGYGEVGYQEDMSVYYRTCPVCNKSGRRQPTSMGV